MNRILIAYGTRGGAAAEVAEALGQVLTRAGAAVTVRPARDVDDVAGYDGVILGSAVRAGRLMREVRRLARRHREALRAVPVALFVVCLTMKDDTEANRRTVANYLAPLRKWVAPVSEGLFAGRVDPARLGFFARLALRAVRAPRGDFRDWDAIRAWAAALPPPFTADTENTGSGTRT